MPKTLLLLPALLFSTCAFASSKQVVITGRIINLAPSSSKVVKANFFNPIKHNGISVKADAQGRFSFKEEMMFTQDMTLNYDDNYFVYLYVSPGDSVNVILDASLLNDDNKSWVKITGSHALLSTQLNQCIQYMYAQPSYTYNYNVSPANMLDTVKKDYARYIQLLQQYAAKHKPAPEVLQFMQADIKYIISNNISDYGNMGSDSKDRQAHIQLFAGPFFNIYNDGSFASQMFPYHLTNYMYTLTRADSSIAAAIAQTRFTYAIHNGAALLLQQPAGNARDYMMFRYLSFFIHKSPHILDSVPGARQYFTTAEYYNELISDAEAIINPKFTPIATEDVTYLQPGGDSTNLPAGDVIQYLVKQNPGKVIYIDVYATWCHPCLAEFKNVPAIHEAFKDKDVVFAYLCLNSTSHAAWKKIIAANSLQGSHFYFNPDATKLFMGNYMLEGYPSYIIVNRQGRIVTNNAPRPSQKEQLTLAINTLLAE